MERQVLENGEDPDRDATVNQGTPQEEPQREPLPALRSLLERAHKTERSESHETSGEPRVDDDTDSADNIEKQRRVRNQTPHRLVVTTAAGERIAFAPLEERVFSTRRLPTDGLDDLGLLKAAETKEIDKREVLMQIVLVALWPVIIGGFILSGVLDDYPGLTPWIWIVAALAVVLVMGTAYIVMTEQEPAVGRLVAQMTTLVLVLAISVGIPAGTVWRFAEEDFWSMSGLDVFVRLAQITIISIAAMLPGLLFFFFDRQKLSTLRNRFERQIFRLDPNVETLADVDARYGRQLEETYGSSHSGEGLRLARQRRLPILIGTIVLSISWTIALAPVSTLPADLDPEGIAEVLAPHANPVSFGFLGAYFYALNLVWRRYTRGDLRPKAYSAITVRILIVLVVTWVVAAVAPDTSPTILVLSFVIGIVPETAFVLLREWSGVAARAGLRSRRLRSRSRWSISKAWICTTALGCSTRASPMCRRWRTMTSSTCCSRPASPPEDWSIGWISQCSTSTAQRRTIEPSSGRTTPTGRARGSTIRTTCLIGCIAWESGRPPTSRSPWRRRRSACWLTRRMAPPRSTRPPSSCSSRA